MTVDVGAAAPHFDLESDAGERVSLEDFAGKWLVLYFYPRDNTPGCTVEAQDFSAAVARLRKLGAEVAGVSKDSVKSHCSFRDKFKLKFPLLSDPELAAHEAYGAWGKKMMYGKQIEGTIRSTFLIGPDGTVARVWRGVKVKGHADAVAAALSELGDAPASKKATKAAPRPKGATASKGKAPPAKKKARRA